MKQPSLKNGIWFLVLLLVVACGDDEPVEPPYTPPDSSSGLIYTHIFTPSCGVSGCHDGTATSPTLTGATTYQSIFSATPTNGQAQAAGLQLIQPHSADSSFLYQKMVFSTSPFQFGAPMPQGGLTVSADKIEFLRQWIEAGAPELGHVADRNLIE